MFHGEPALGKGSRVVAAGDEQNVVARPQKSRSEAAPDAADSDDRKPHAGYTARFCAEPELPNSR